MKKIGLFVVTALVLGLVSFGATLTRSVSVSDITPVNFHSTLQGMISAAKGSPGTFLYQSPDQNLVIMAWQVGKDYAFVSLAKTGDPVRQLSDIVGNGNKTDIKNIVDLLASLTRCGWKRILPADLDPFFVSTLQSITTQAVANGSRSLTTIFFVPAAVFDQTEYEQ